jgi:hypothetical protein
MKEAYAEHLQKCFGQHSCLYKECSQKSMYLAVFKSGKMLFLKPSDVEE